MVKPTNKTLAQLKKQEGNLEAAITRYNGSPKLVRAENITEQQIKAKGGSVGDSARVAAIKRRLAKGKKNG